MWPHSFGAAFSAKSGLTLRRNAVIMPLYTLELSRSCSSSDSPPYSSSPTCATAISRCLAMVRKTFPPWFLGIIGGAGALTAMVPAAILILSSATLVREEPGPPDLAPDMNDHQVVRT